MNKFFTRITAIVVIALVAIGCGGKKSAKEATPAKPFEAKFFAYVDAKQLVEKSDLMSYLDESQREFIATLATAELESDEDAAYIKSVIMDLSMTGLSLDKPAYAYFRDFAKHASEGAVVIEVNDVEKLKRLLEFFAEKSGDISIVKSGNNYNVVSEDFDENTAIGFNSERLIIAGSALRNGEQMLADAFAAADPDFAYFDKRDAALWVDANFIFDIIESNTRNSVEHLRESVSYYPDDEWYAEQLATMEGQLAQFEKIRRENVGPNASITMGLTFNDGNVALDVTTDGFKVEDVPATTVTNAHLNYLPYNTVAVANMGIIGDKLVKVLNTVFTDEFAAQNGIERNEFRTMKEIASGAIGSINGDITAALTKIEGYSANQTPYIEAVALADVKDSYIFNNIKLFGQGYIRRINDNNYAFDIDNYNAVFFGEQNNLLYAGLNTRVEQKPNSAANTRWAKETEGSLGYMLIDVKGLMEQSYIRSVWNTLAYEIGDTAFGIINDFVDMLDYVCVKTNSTSNGELRIALKDERTNSLNQLVGFAVEAAPVIIEAATTEQKYEEYDDEYYYDEEPVETIEEPAW